LACADHVKPSALQSVSVALSVSVRFIM
jgi:hypothetical protein